MYILVNCILLHSFLMSAMITPAELTAKQPAEPPVLAATEKHAHQVIVISGRGHVTTAVTEPTENCKLEAALWSLCKLSSSKEFGQKAEWVLPPDIQSDAHFCVGLYATTHPGHHCDPNQYDFPPPVENTFFYGKVVLVAFTSTGVPTSLSKEMWEQTFNFHVEGIEDLDDTKEMDDDDLENEFGDDSSYEGDDVDIAPAARAKPRRASLRSASKKDKKPKKTGKKGGKKRTDESDGEDDDKKYTRAGYLKDGFVVDDDDDAGSDSEDEYDDNSDNSTEDMNDSIYDELESDGGIDDDEDDSDYEDDCESQLSQESYEIEEPSEDEEEEARPKKRARTA